MPRCRHVTMAALVSVLIGLLTASHLWRVCADEFTGVETRREFIPPESWSANLAANATSNPSNPTTFVWPRTWNLGGDVTFKLRGRIDTDAIASSQSALNEATFGDLGDVVGLRRARIGAEGALGSNARYLIEVDLPDGQVIPRDIYAAYGDRQACGELQAGHFREPFSLEGGTSVRTFPFMERSPVNMLDPARNWGLGLFRESLNANTAWAFGAFHAGSDVGGLQGGDGDTVGFTSRLTHAPVNEGNGERLVHFGLALSERVPENGFIIINQQPKSPLLDQGDSSTSPYVPTIRIPASYEQLINLQFAAARGSWWTQAEWYGALIDQTGGDTVFFHGCHVDCGYFLTGEHREYDSTNGVLGAVRVNRPFLHCCGDGGRPHGWGAWELTARYSYLDFFDRSTPVGPDGQLVGVRLPDGTFGVNWYLCDTVRLMFNYSYEVPNEMNTGASAASIYSTRLEVFW